MEKAVIIELVLLGVFIFGFFVFGGKLQASSKQAAEDDICLSSIVSQSRARVLGKPLDLYGGLKCPRKTLEIKKDDVVVKGTIDQKKASAILAESMRECWRRVGQGKLDPFSQWEGEDQSYCLICSSLDFDKNMEKFLKDNPTQHIVPPVNYLATTSITKNGPTYWKYLYNAEAGSASSQAIKEMENKPVPDGSLVLVSMYRIEERRTLESWTDIAITVGSLVVLGPFGLAASVGGLFAQEAFRDCPDCNAVGGVYLISSEQALDINLKATINGDSKEIRLCDYLVN